MDDHDARNLSLRYTIAGLSLVSAASMAATSLLQLGIVRDLPDPPWRGFDSKKVNLSEDAFPMGVPDGPLAVGSALANVALASLGGRDRARRHPALPLLAAAKAAVDTLVGAYLFYKMPTKEKAWCVYCIVATTANAAVLASAIPEAVDAGRVLLGARDSAPAAK